MFRFKSGVKVDYNRQGYIYFTSRLYKDLPEEDQRVILNLCLEHSGESYQALFEYGLIVPIFGPIIGGLLAVLLYNVIPWAAV